MKAWQQFAVAIEEGKWAVVEWESMVPFCQDEACPWYDGKRCEAFGFKPDTICEPTVQRMGELLNAFGPKSLPATTRALSDPPKGE